MGRQGCAPPFSPISFIFMQFSAKIFSNKNAFQYDAYRPLIDHIRGRGVPAWGGPCDLSHHAFDVTCMLSCHQLRLITSAAAYIVFGHVTCGACWDTPLDRMTDTCKNITLANLRAVIIGFWPKLMG